MKTKHEVLMQDAEYQRLFAMESLVGYAGELIAELMREQGVSKSELAQRLGKSRSWITQLLSGKANMTVRTLAEVSHALGSEVKLEHRLLTGYSAKPQTPRYVLDAGTTQRDSEELPPIKPGYAA